MKIYLTILIYGVLFFATACYRPKIEMKALQSFRQGRCELPLKEISTLASGKKSYLVLTPLHAQKVENLNQARLEVILSGGKGTQAFPVEGSQLAFSNWISNPSQKSDIAIYHPFLSGENLSTLHEKGWIEIQLNLLAGFEGEWSLYLVTAGY